MKPLFKTKRMCIATLLALVMVVAVGATLALMASSPQFLTNTFAAADVDTEVDENTDGANVKTVWIENNGKSPVYVRARIMVSGVDPKQIEIVDSEEEAEKEAVDNPTMLFLVMPNVKDEANCWQQVGEDISKDNKDGFYYYLGVLQPGTSTSNLMTKVIIPDGDFKKELEAMGDKFNITIYHESVLAIGDAPETITADTVRTAFETADGNTTSSTTP